ncbi:MAG TPA: hypothetical protein VND15_00760 [Candidatus Acidoferrales bacterium]|nr:hypothetical protein [Candidatus Acidoferrales bacterium]
MASDINFIDLIALSRVKTDTVVEKFGSLINSSFFDASNILGGLKQKGLVDFTTTFPGQSALTITDLGKTTVVEANDKAKGEFDHLDFAVISELAKGKRSLTDITGAVNVTSRDLAMHLYKLAEQQYLSYEFRNGSIDITLTEKGFLQVQNGMPVAPPVPGAPQTVPVQPAPDAQAAQPPATEPAATVPPVPAPMMGNRMLIMGVATIVVIIVVVAVWMFMMGRL